MPYFDVGMRGGPWDMGGRAGNFIDIPGASASRRYGGGGAMGGAVAAHTRMEPSPAESYERQIRQRVGANFNQLNALGEQWSKEVSKAATHYGAGDGGDFDRVVRAEQMAQAEAADAEFAALTGGLHPSQFYLSGPYRALGMSEHPQQQYFNRMAQGGAQLARYSLTGEQFAGGVGVR